MLTTSREFRTFHIRDSRNGNTRKKDGSAMSCVCRSHRKNRNCGWKLFDQSKAMTEEQREMSERCVRGLGYQGITFYVRIGMQTIWKN